MADVTIIAGSTSDKPLVAEVEKVLKEHGISYEAYIASAHLEPERVKQIVKTSKAKVFIAVAGLSASLPGFIASYTKKPVIGLPRDVKLLGLDALLAMVQLPPGVPVAVVGIDNAKNAALLAIRMLSIA